MLLKCIIQCFLVHSRSFVTITTKLQNIFIAIERNPQPLQPLPILDFSHPGNHLPILFLWIYPAGHVTWTQSLSMWLWCLNFFFHLHHHVSMVYSHCSMYQYFILFIAEWYSMVWIYHVLFIHPLFNSLLDCFSFFFLLLWILVCFMWTHAFISLGHMTNPIEFPCVFVWLFRCFLLYIAASV